MTPTDRNSANVSILIAAFNAADFLSRAVASALAQGEHVREVLIVDDASTDRTVQVAEELAAADARVRLIRLMENGGPSTARNAGIDAATGDWIVVLDADDAVLPGRTDRLVDLATRVDADVVVDNFAWYNPRTGDTVNGLPESEETELVTLHRFLDRARPYTDESDWGLLKPMFRKSFLEMHGLRYPTHSRHGEDYLLMVALLKAGGRYALTRVNGYLYTQRWAGQSRTRLDYDGMAQQSEDLLSDSKIKADPSLARLMQQRVRSIRRLAADYKVRTSMHDRKLGTIALEAVQDPVVARELARFVWKKAKALRHRG